MKQRAVHRRYFCNYWIPFCAVHNYNPFEYSVPAVANCLDFQQTRAAELALSEGRKPQHGGLKQLRAAISETLKVIHGKRISMEPVIQAIAVTARIEAPNARRYATTFSVQIVFDFYYRLWDEGQDNWTMSINSLRSKSILLGRLVIGNRSSDMRIIHRTFHKDHSDLQPAGIFGGWKRDGGVKIERVRYDTPKTARSQAGDMSRWVSCGKYARGNARDEAICFRSAVETYFVRTNDLPREDDWLFLSLAPRESGPNRGKYFGIGSDRIRNVTKDEMKAIGIDVDRFKPHVLRHTSLAHKAAAGIGREKFLLDAAMSGETYDKYYRVEIEDPTSAPYLPVIDDRAPRDASAEVD